MDKWEQPKRLFVPNVLRLPLYRNSSIYTDQVTYQE